MVWKTAVFAVWAMFAAVGSGAHVAAAPVIVAGIELSSDTAWLAINLEHEIAVLNLRSGRASTITVGRFTKARTVRFGSDNRTLLLGKNNRNIALYALPDIEPFAVFPIGAIVTDARFLPGGEKVLIGLWDGRLEIWNTMDRRRVESVRGHLFGGVRLDVSADGRFAVSAGDDQTVRLWELNPLHFVRYLVDGRYGIKANRAMMSNVAFVEGGTRVVASSWLPYCGPHQASVQMFDPANGRLLRAVTDQRGCGSRSLAVAGKAGRALFFGQQGRLSVLRLGDFAVSGLFDGAGHLPTAFTLSGDGRLGVSAGPGTEPWTTDIQFWSIAAARPVARLTLGLNSIAELMIHGDKRPSIRHRNPKSLADLVDALKSLQ